MAYHVFVFFFKQKTAYEMRISDWSSDVCSSDLQLVAFLLEDREIAHARCQQQADAALRRAQHQRPAGEAELLARFRRCLRCQSTASHCRSVHAASRSEEHTSELQSLMRISYAVFCLKKKKYYIHKQKKTIHSARNE